MSRFRAAPTVHALMSWFNVKDFGAKGDSVQNADGTITTGTDDTTAIQSAIKAANNAGGGTIYFPRGIYACSGALTNWGTNQASNSILYVPYNDIANGEITLHFLGEFPAPLAYAGDAANVLPPNEKQASILYFATTPSGTLPAGLQGPTSSGFGYTYAVFENLIFRQPANPGLTNLLMDNVSKFRTTQCAYDVATTIGPTMAQPTIDAGRAFTCPFNGNGAFTVVEKVFVVGYGRGMITAEHASLRDVFVQFSTVGISAANGFHSQLWERVLIQKCPTAIENSMTSSGFIRITELDIEDAGSGYWYSPIYHISDPNNHFYGTVYAHRVLANSGPETGPLTLNGATNLTITTM